MNKKLATTVKKTNTDGSVYFDLELAPEKLLESLSL